MTDRPDLSRGRTRPRPAGELGDPADPVTAPATSNAAAQTTPAATPKQDAPTRRPASGTRLAPISTAAPTVAVQYRLTDAERDVLLRMQEARGDRRGIDTMRWFLASFGEEAIRRAAEGR